MKKERIWTVVINIAFLAILAVWGWRSFSKKSVVVPHATVPVVNLQATSTPAVPTSTVKAPPTLEVGTTTASVGIKIVPKKLPYVANAFTKNDWTLNWGELSILGGTLVFGSSASTTGGTVLLNGSNAWTNYDMQAYVTWDKGKAFNIFARFADMQNFVYCNFGSDYVGLIERVNGTDTVIAENYSATVLISDVEQLGIKVYDNKVACDVGGNDVVAADLVVPDPPHGEIGFSSWDPMPGNSEIIMNSVSVAPLITDSIIVVPPLSAVASSTTTQISGQATTSVPATPTSSLPAPRLPYSENNFTNDTNWAGTWGNVTTTASGALAIGATSKGSGGSAYLVNTSPWAKYVFTAALDWPTGETFSLIGNYQDNENYVECLFDATSLNTVDIHLEQFINGAQHDIQDGTADLTGEWRSGATASIALSDTAGTCSFDNHSVSNSGGNAYTLNPPFHGNIGFSTWDPTLGKAQIVVKSVSISQ